MAQDGALMLTTGQDFGFCNKAFEVDHLGSGG
jgi:hypothetical protein